MLSLSDQGAVVVADHLQAAAYLPSRGRRVLSLHNAEVAFLRELPRPAGLPGRLRRAWDLRTMARTEAAALTRAQLVVTVSDRDAALLGGPTLVIPNGCDPPTDVPPRPVEGTVLFVGLLSYLPNREAVRWWSEQVWPHLPAGSRQLTAVGAGAEHVPLTPAVVASVELTGPVEDVGAELSRAAVVVIPLQHGGGTRLKVLEAFAWGRPVVSTRKGVEGLPVVDGVHALLADSGADFAGAVERVLADPELTARLAAAGQELARSYAWSVVTAPLLPAIERLSRL